MHHAPRRQRTLNIYPGVKMIVALNKNGKYYQARWVDLKTGIVQRRSLGLRSNLTASMARACCHAIETEILTAAALPKIIIPQIIVTMNEVMRLFLVEKEPDLLKSSIYKHVKTMSMVRNCFGGESDVKAITEEQAQMFRLELVSAANSLHGKGTLARNKAETTISRYCRRAKSYFEWAIKRNYIEKNPFVHVNTYAPDIQVPRRVFEESEIKMIMDAAKPNLRMLIALCFYAGLRKNEAIRLRLTDVDFTRNRISVWPPEGRVSSKHKFREVFLEPELSQMIKERGYCDTVVQQITGERAWIDLHAAIKKTEIKNAEGLNFQLMRSSRENIWFARGIPPNVVTAWLGHTAQIAAKHYRGVPESYYKTAQNEISKDEQISQLMSQVRLLTLQKDAAK